MTVNEIEKTSERKYKRDKRGRTLKKEKKITF